MDKYLCNDRRRSVNPSTYRRRPRFILIYFPSQEIRNEFLTLGNNAMYEQRKLVVRRRSSFRQHHRCLRIFISLLFFICTLNNLCFSARILQTRESYAFFFYFCGGFILMIRLVRLWNFNYTHLWVARRVQSVIFNFHVCTYAFTWSNYN